jgi:tripartite-type tricarboxylate transporter receptor subunit TctC
MTHVPYKGTSIAALDLAAGRVHMAITNVLSAQQTLKTGKTRALAVTSPKRSLSLPELPTLAEAGVPGFEVTSWYGLYVPVKTPQGVVLALNREATRAVNSPDIKAKLATDGSEAVGPNTPAEFKTYFFNEIDKWTHFVKVTGVKPSE